MTNKRKNIDMIAPTYEEGWLFHLCRQRGWTREETFVLNAPPAACMDHLMDTPQRDQRFKYTLDAQNLDGEYEFKVRVRHWRRWFEKVPPEDIRTTLGQVVPCEGDAQRSLVTIRTYPQITALTLIIGISWIMVSIICVVMDALSLIHLKDMLGAAPIAVLVFVTHFLYMIFDTFRGRQRGLGIVRTIFTGDPSIPTLMPQKGKKVPLYD